jgi:sortase A
LLFQLRVFEFIECQQVGNILNQNSGAPTNRQRLARVFWVLGLALIGLYVVIRAYGHAANFLALEAFSLQGTAAAAEPLPDFSLWDSKRVDAYKQALLKKISPPLGVLEINRLGLKVSIFEGTSDFVLDRGVGHIEDTEPIDGKGNIGIAGHRDGFFRGLKDLVRGDTINLTAPGKKYIYKIDQILIVNPDDVYVLDPGPKPTVTLVTCYPFYFFGHAPRRYIVKASLQRTESIKNISQSK